MTRYYFGMPDRPSRMERGRRRLRWTWTKWWRYRRRGVSVVEEGDKVTFYFPVEP